MAANSNVVACDQHFREAMTSLEACLATPVVSGDLVEWARNADIAMRNFMLRWLERRDVSHHKSLMQIGEDDPELLARVELLQQDCDKITHEGQRLAAMAAYLAGASNGAEPNEAKLDSVVSTLADDGLIWLAQVRRQEIAVQTWLTEASHRDRGVIDEHEWIRSL